MQNKYRLISLLLVFGAAVTTSKAEISTLFTTVQERQLINTNRYQSDKAKPQQAKKDHHPAKQNIQQLVREQVRETLTISGITVSNSGPNVVWINNQVYEDGDKLGNQSRINILTTNPVKVRITAPDGKQYFAASGETIEMVYLAAVD